MSTLSKDDLLDILNGAAILSCGGGGPYSLGQQLVELLSAGAPVELMASKDVKDSDWMGVTAFEGSPEAAKAGNLDYGTATLALTELERLTKKRFNQVLPGELGTVNVFVPMFVAMQKKLPVIDATCTRRAVPALDQCTYAAAPISPVVLASRAATMSFTAANATMAESFSHELLGDPVFADSAGIALWSMDGRQMRSVIIDKSITYARKLGKALRDAKSSGADPVAAVCSYLGGSVLFKGKLSSEQQQTTGAFDIGTIVFQNGSKDQLWISSQNENLIAWQSSKAQPLAMIPDLIAYLTTDGQPFSNTEIPNNKEIVVIGAPGPTQLWSDSLLPAFRRSLRQAGYPGQVLRITRSKSQTG